MLGDSEDFLSLEDGDDAPKPEAPHKTRSSSPDSTKAIDAEVIDMEVIGDYSGTHTICWPIQDMDCPHCASVAMDALNRLDLVTFGGLRLTGRSPRAHSFLS